MSLDEMWMTERKCVWNNETNESKNIWENSSMLW